MKKADKIYSIAWAVPALALYVILFVLPLVAGLYSSMTDWTMGKDVIRFIGLDNFAFILNDPELLGSIGNTFIYTAIVVVFKNLLGFSLAVAVNIEIGSRVRVNDFFRTVFYLPAVLSTIVIGVVFIRILHPDGLLNNILNSIGLSSLAADWLVDTKIVMVSIAGVSVWQWVGYHMAIYLAGMQGISHDYYEAAMIDGASSAKRLAKITVPLLMPTITINVILSLIGGLKGFSEVYALTGGGPGHASQVLTTEVLSKFGEGRWGLGTALNTLLLVLVAMICIPLLWQMRRQEVEG
jgi:raffinose/stachyose/melibiose transport system permease protein